MFVFYYCIFRVIKINARQQQQQQYQGDEIRGGRGCCHSTDTNIGQLIESVCGFASSPAAAAWLVYSYSLLVIAPAATAVGCYAHFHIYLYIYISVHIYLLCAAIEQLGTAAGRALIA